MLVTNIAIRPILEGAFKILSQTGSGAMVRVSGDAVKIYMTARMELEAA